MDHQNSLISSLKEHTLSILILVVVVVVCCEYLLENQMLSFEEKVTEVSFNVGKLLLHPVRRNILLSVAYKVLH